MTTITRDELRGGIQALLVGVQPGETRVSYPDGSSKIFDNFQLLEDDLVRFIDKYTEAQVREAVEKELQEISASGKHARRADRAHPYYRRGYENGYRAAERKIKSLSKDGGGDE